MELASACQGVLNVFLPQDSVGEIPTANARSRELDVGAMVFGEWRAGVFAVLSWRRALLR